jgi:hypothetical protein
MRLEKPQGKGQNTFGRHRALKDFIEVFFLGVRVFFFEMEQQWL